MNRSRKLVLVALVLALAGAILCELLLRIHVEGQKGGWLASVCGGEDQGCDKVVNSSWGVFPPASSRGSAPAMIGTDTPERVKGVPVAALGLFYFSCLAIWFAAVGRARGAGRSWLHGFVVVVCFGGVLGSVFYSTIMAVVIGAWCPLCLSAHVCNFLLLGCVVRIWFLERTHRKARHADSGKGKAPPTPVHPTLSYATVVLVLIAAVCTAEWKGYRAAAVEAERDELAEALQGFRGDEEWLETSYYKSPKYYDNAAQRKRPSDLILNLRPDDPIIPTKWKGTRNTLVMFSDIECPSCFRFEKRLKEEIRPLYSGHLRIVYKHNPLTNMHPNAMKGAQGLEAARLQVKFWELHDLLLENRETLASFDYKAAAKQLGMNVDRFMRDMFSRAVADRIKEDVATAKSVGVGHTTPGVFLNGRNVNKRIRDLIAFWRNRSEDLKKIRLDGGALWGADELLPLLEK